MTTNVWLVVLPFVGFCRRDRDRRCLVLDAWVVSMISVPLGLVDDSVAELIVSGLTGWDGFSGRGVVHDRDGGHLVDVFTPVSNWPKSV